MERKLATVLFVDLVDSSGLVAASDPEVVRRRVSRFFEQVSKCIEGHGGTVEKFAGDAVMAAFGVPQAHEDDAERAVKAALAILESVDLPARIGVESGEVVTEATDSTFATGDAVNLAARLQQSAEPGQVLIGPGTHRLTLGRIETEDLGPVEIRGRAEPVWAWVAISANGTAPARVVITPLIGRDHELELLENTYSRAIRDRRAHLFTIYGEPGVGKTRLANEFLESLEGATVVSGRALPYGESITYWPLAEMVKNVAGISDDDPLEVAIEKLRECCPAEAVADLLGLATGVLEAVHGERSQQEIAWAAREWAQLMAQTQPLVLVFEDIHWAEEPLLELIEHITEWVREGPLLILCLARAELLDIRPDWGGGRLRATSIELEALSAGDSEQLIDALSAGAGVTPETRKVLLEKTEGNPLFLEEVMRTVEECGEEEAAAGIPDTVQALIGARIDRLPAGSKAVLQRASVIGRSFWGGAIAHLVDEDVEDALRDLLMRDMVVVESRSSISGETPYRFKHVLIKEVAYSGLSKSSRAGLHGRFAGWLQERAGDELLEIRAYHLDQAAALMAELDGAPPPELAQEAAAALHEAGRRALAREANRAARTSFLRALELEPTPERRYLAAKAARRLDDLPAVAREMEIVREEAERTGNNRLHGRALTSLSDVALMRDADLPRAKELVERALSVLDPTDSASRFDALEARSWIGWWTGRLIEAEPYIRDALAAAQEVGRKDLEAGALDLLASTHRAKLELDEAERLLAHARDLAEESGAVVGRGWIFLTWTRVYLLRGNIEQAEASSQEAIRLFSEAGAAWGAARALTHGAWAAWSGGDQTKAEKRFREAIRLLKPLGDRAALCESQRGLAQLLVELGRIDEAERFALEARETVGPADITSLSTTSSALGVVRAAQGRDLEAEALLRDAVDLIAPTDFREAELEAQRSLAQFLRSRERDDEAEAVEARCEELLPAWDSTARMA
ncbi:MAG: AAA family ATPase [Actinobacteria bacterium]|nr:AAA family ATPase [Actinomycetota bacterium]